MSVIASLSCIGIWNYETYEANFKSDDRKEEEFKDLASRELKSAFSMIGKASPEEKAPERQALIRQLVTSPVTISSWKAVQVVGIK
jgi:hypothetical protein